MCEKSRNTCAQFKNRNQVCAKNQETHADNSKTGIKYVRKIKKHMRIIQKTGIRYVQKSWKHMRIIQKPELGMCKKTGNTCGQFKNWNQVCAKKLDTHADNSKTGIWYVQKSWIHMRTVQNKNQVCITSRKIHALKQKIMIRHV